MWPQKIERHSLVSFNTPKMLVLLENPRDLSAVREFTGDTPWRVTFADDLKAAHKVTAGSVMPIVLLDRDLAGIDWRSSVRSFAKGEPNPCVILASAVLDDYLFDEVVRQGGFEIVAKPIRVDELRRVAGLALAFWNSRF